MMVCDSKGLRRASLFDVAVNGYICTGNGGICVYFKVHIALVCIRVFALPNGYFCLSEGCNGE